MIEMCEKTKEELIDEGKDTPDEREREDLRCTR
jgi:hypothetical protein